MKFSVIIPTWNEARQISAGLRRLREISNVPRQDLEIIVVDGGSTDGTAEEARRAADRIEVLERPNRGAQLHRGAQMATGDMFFFLHADTQPPDDWSQRLERFWLAKHERPPSATVFTVDYGARWNYKLVAFGQNLRATCYQVAYGDAGICTTRELYQASGGIPEIPLMEDVEFSRRLRGLGPIIRLAGRIHPGARRLRRNGAFRNTVSNLMLRLRFSLGEKPEELWRRYYAQGGKS